MEGRDCSFGLKELIADGSSYVIIIRWVIPYNVTMVVVIAHSVVCLGSHSYQALPGMVVFWNS